MVTAEVSKLKLDLSQRQVDEHTSSSWPHAFFFLYASHPFSLFGWLPQVLVVFHSLPHVVSLFVPLRHYAYNSPTAPSPATDNTRERVLLDGPFKILVMEALLTHFEVLIFKMCFVETLCFYVLIRLPQ